MRLVVALVLMVGCANTSTPEDFVGPYVERLCAAGAECGVYESVDLCMTLADNWQARCTTERLPDWDPSTGSACLAEVATYACQARLEQAESPCYRICGE